MMVPSAKPAAAASAVSAAGLSLPLLEMRPKAIWQALRAEHVAFIAITLYLMLEYIKPEQAYPIFGILPFLRIAWITALFALWADKLAKLPRSPFNYLLPLYLLHCLISSFLAYRSDYSFAKFSIIALWVLMYFLISTIVTTERRLFLFFVGYLLSNLKMSQFGFFTWMRRGFGFASWGLTGAGWFHNSGELGLEMAMFFAYTLCLAIFLRQHWSGWRKWLMYFMPFSAAACVIASSSRGAIVGSIAVLFYLSLFSRRKIRAWLASALVIVLAYYVMPPQFMARFRTAGEDATSLSRIFYWSKAKEMMRTHPWFGVGYYNWVPYYTDHYFDPTLYWRVEEAHNTFWQMGAELGYTGLGLFILMVTVSFFMNWKSERLCRRPGFEYLRAVSLGMNAAGIGLLFSSMFLTSFFMPNYWIHFAFTTVVRNAINRKIAATAAVAEAGKAPDTPDTAAAMPSGRHRTYGAYPTYPGLPGQQAGAGGQGTVEKTAVTQRSRVR
jgi:putative inorganic carbon (hco3(-)) transporter